MNQKLNIRNFKRLRNYIAKHVTPGEVYMDWYFAVKTRNIFEEFSVGCDTPGCIYGHCAAHFKNNKSGRYTAQSIVNFCNKFLGIDPLYARRLMCIACWPEELQNDYRFGMAIEKKNAVLERLDRVIERGDLY
jgi:hypothetical protein